MTALRHSRTRLIGLVLLLALVVAMLLNTKFLTPQALANIGPKPFDPAQTAATLFTKAQTDVASKGKPLTEVLPAVQADIKGAATKYGAVSPAENSYVFAVTATGIVGDVTTADDIRLQITGLPAGSTVLVPTTAAINGTVLRDAMGFKFAEAPGQTQFQYVGDELKKLMQDKVVAPAGDPMKLKGKTVTVTGVIGITASPGSNTVPTAKPVNIQPVKIEVAS